MRTRYQPHSQRHVGHLMSEVNRLITSSLAPSTWRTYQAGKTAFDQFRAAFGLPSLWPIPLDQWLQFIAYLSVSGRSPATARSYVSGLAALHKLHNMCDVSHHFLVQKALSGMSRLSHRQDTRQPITTHLLAEITRALPLVCSQSYEAALFAAAYLLTFFGFFRVGELVAASARDSTNRACLFSDITVAGDLSAIQVHLRSSKTDQGGLGAYITIQALPNSPLCPVAAVQRFRCIRPTGTGYFFTHFDSSPLTKFQFQAVLKKALASIPEPINPSLYSSHSFRIGAATTAALQGVSSQQIQELGRWKSAAYQTYIRIPSIL
ncbi:uncharacterized protein LOC124274582 [Haliotis rubra]|uniref:uncharacterized protein LOC124274582 n=1 Tax=Haliotis rubra TaxID=36100 RepID=UPI001EE633C8|nr:uncharacterized protein LOC124274582 [Haliotis rubra]